MKKDYLGLIINKLRFYRIGLFRVFTSFLMKLILKVKGVKFGKSCRFYGLPIIVRSPYSTIIIGSKLTVRSDATSNLFGLFKRTTIATAGRFSKLEIGDNCGLSSASITAFENIKIGDNVLVGANAIITDSDWHSLNPKDRNNKVKTSQVTIGNNVWIGANSIVLKGVTIGENTIIGAGSIVTKNIPSNSIAGGNPCIIIRKL